MNDKSGITVTVTTNAADVAQNLGAGTREIMEKLPFILRAFMVLTVRDLLDKSYPAPNNMPRMGGGGTPAAKQQGDDNIRDEINRAFTTWGNSSIGDLIMAKNEAVLWNLNNQINWRNERLKKAWEKKDINTLYDAFKANGWVKDTEQHTTFVNEPTVALHNKMRDPTTGRIRASILANPQLRISVKDRRAIEDFIIQRQQSVGKMAGGWIKALTALGSSQSNPFKAGGTGGATVSADGMSISASNMYGDFNQMISSQGIIEDIMKEQSENLGYTLQKEVDDILNKHQTGGGVGTTPPTGSNGKP